MRALGSEYLQSCLFLNFARLCKVWAMMCIQEFVCNYVKKCVQSTNMWNFASGHVQNVCNYCNVQMWKILHVCTHERCVQCVCRCGCWSLFEKIVKECAKVWMCKISHICTPDKKWAKRSSVQIDTSLKMCFCQEKRLGLFYQFGQLLSPKKAKSVLNHFALIARWNCHSLSKKFLYAFWLIFFQSNFHDANCWY